MYMESLCRIQPQLMSKIFCEISCQPPYLQIGNYWFWYHWRIDLPHGTMGFTTKEGSHKQRPSADCGFWTAARSFTSGCGLHRTVGRTIDEQSIGLYQIKHYHWLFLWRPFRVPVFFAQRVFFFWNLFSSFLVSKIDSISAQKPSYLQFPRTL